jgi:hypothetical protein
MVISHRFCPAGQYWADIITPTYATIAIATTPLAAAQAALRAFEQAHPSVDKPPARAWAEAKAA